MGRKLFHILTLNVKLLQFCNDFRRQRSVRLGKSVSDRLSMVSLDFCWPIVKIRNKFSMSELKSFLLTMGRTGVSSNCSAQQQEICEPHSNQGITRRAYSESPA